MRHEHRERHRARVHLGVSGAQLEDERREYRERRFKAALFGTDVLKFWANGWVDAPNKTPRDIVDWLKHTPMDNDKLDGEPNAKAEAR